MLELRCDCGARMRVRSSAMGKQARCPKCRRPVPVRAQSSPVEIPRAEPIPWVAATPVDDGFDLDFPPVIPAAPRSAAPARGLGLPSFAMGGSQPTPYWAQQSAARKVNLKAGSPPTQVIRGGLIALLVIISLSMICQVGFAVTVKVSKSHARELRSQRPTTMAERDEFLEKARKLGERYVNVLKFFRYGYHFLRAPALVAVLACGIGLVMAAVQVRGGLLVVLVINVIVGLMLIVIDAVKRSVPLMTFEGVGLDAPSIPADMWLATLGGFESMSGMIWTAGAIEVLWGAFLVCLGIFSSMWRYSQNRGDLTLPILLSVGGAVYSLGMLGLASSLASLTFMDNRGTHFVVYVMLMILFWTLALFAVLISHRDATPRHSG